MLQMSHHLVQDASVTPATETVLSQGTGENCQTSHENQNASEEFKINVKSEYSNYESVSQKQLCNQDCPSCHLWIFELAE